jgi:hypothetical protein
MNRPYYALAALVAMLGGAAAAVSPAHCHSATAGVANSSRSLCSSSPRDLVVAANLFVHFESGWEAGLEEYSSNEQGSDQETQDYDDSCGYDPYRGETYDAEVAATDDTSESSESEPTANINAGTFAEECETWPSDERIDAGYRDFEGCGTPPVCGGEELHCPYIGGRLVQPYRHFELIEDYDCGERTSENDACQRAHEQWLANESAFFAEKKDEAWKTTPVTTPDWIADYLNACMPSLEEQYAAAELQAALEAEANFQPKTEVVAPEYGPELPSAPAPTQAEYSDEYESLYNLDAYLADAAEDTDEADDDSDDAEIVWALIRVFGKLIGMADDFGDDAEELLESSEEALQQWNAAAVQIASSLRTEAAIDAAYGNNVDYPIYSSEDIIISNDEQIVGEELALPIETAESRELLYSLAEGLRIAGQLLLNVADGIEAEAKNVLSAQYDEAWSD